MKSLAKLQLIFVITSLLGCVIVFNSLVFWPLLPVTKVDAVLTPEEVQDPKLREVVKRTAEHEIALQPSTTYAVLGGLILVTSIFGVASVQRHRNFESSESGRAT